MSDARIDRQLAFLAEADALKSVQRQSRITGTRRRENSAEHSWHLALFALVLAADEPGVDAARVVAMLLIHDLVEIDAGDAPIHGAHDIAAVQRAEHAAAQRIFALLPDDQEQRMLALWREFSGGTTADARFARALDRFQPLLLNTLTDGGTWAENAVDEPLVHARYGPPIARGSAALWHHAARLLARHFAHRDGSTDVPG